MKLAIISTVILLALSGCGDSSDVNPVDNATSVGVVQYPTPLPPVAPDSPGYIPNAGGTP